MRDWLKGSDEWIPLDGGKCPVPPDTIVSWRVGDTVYEGKKMGDLLDSALNSQVGGDHYKDMPIQPLEYCHANGIGKIEGDVIAYVSRWKLKGGIQDLEKARHELDILIELEKRKGGHG